MAGLARPFSFLQRRFFAALSFPRKRESSNHRLALSMTATVDARASVLDKESELGRPHLTVAALYWMPAFAGMTMKESGAVIPALRTSITLRFTSST
jgi:hypothetical protein